MRSRTSAPPLTLLDVVTTVSRLARDEREAAAVINHLLSSARIRFANTPRREEWRRLLA